MRHSQTRRGRWSSRYLFLPLMLAAFLVLAGCVEARTAATQGWSGVVGEDDVVFVGTDDGRVVQLHATTGTPRVAPFSAPQEERAGFPAFYGTPSLADGLIYAGGYQGIVYALRAETLDRVGSFEIEGNPLTKGLAGSVIPVGDVVVAAVAEDANAGRIYVLRAETLVEACRYPARGDTPIGQIWSTPTVVDGVIYVGSLDHRLHAVRVEDCTAVWSDPADLHGAVVAPPFHIDGKLYVGTFDRRFYEVNMATGDSRELFRAGNWFWGGVASDGQRLFIPNLDGRLYAYDLHADAVAWTYPQEATRFPMLATPLVHGNTVIVGSDSGVLTAIRTSDGQREWDIQLRGGEIRSPLTEVNGVLYVQAVDGRVSAVDLAGMRIIWDRVLGDVR